MSTTEGSPLDVQSTLTAILSELTTIKSKMTATEATVAALQADVLTIKGDQSRLTVAVNRLQSEKVEDSSIGGENKTEKPKTSSGDGIPLAAQRVHKLVFPVYNGLEDPLPWLNRCEQFFRAQQTPNDGKVWLASFYMTGDAQQWYYRLEKNRGQPTLAPP